MIESNRSPFSYNPSFSNYFPTFNSSEFLLKNLQLEGSEIAEAFEILRKIPLKDWDEAIQCTLTLEKMQIKG